MAFVPGDYQPPPVSDDREESPPPFNFGPPPLLASTPNQVAIVGLELIIRGLDRTSSTSAPTHLERIVQEIRKKGEPIPDLHVVSPPSRENLDYVFVSLAGNLRLVPRPDILERVRVTLDAVPGIQARWKMMKGLDKARQVYFVAEDRSHMSQLKEKLDNIFRSYHYETQSSWLSTQTGRITYNFINPTHIENLFRTYPTVDGIPIEPRQPRFIPPIYGLEVAVNNVGDYPLARGMLDRYINDKYSNGTDPAVRSSRLCLNDSVYCAVLRDPVVTAMFLSDELDLFANTPSPPEKPSFLYSLNSFGIPTGSSFRPPATQESPYMRQQLQNMQAQQTTMFHTIDHLQANQTAVANQIVDQSERHLQAIANILAYTGAQTQMMMAQSDVNAISMASSTTNLLHAMANTPDQRRAADVLANDLRAREQSARASLSSASSQATALRAQLLPTTPAASTFIGAPPTSAQPQFPPGIPALTSSNRASTSAQNEMEEDANDANEVESTTRMQDIE